MEVVLIHGIFKEGMKEKVEENCTIYQDLDQLKKGFSPKDTGNG